MITKNILINLISLFQGGPKTVCTGLLEGIEDFLITNRETTFYLMTPRIPDILEKVDSLQKKFGVNIVHIPLSYPTKHFNFIFKLYYDHYLTAKYAEKNNVDFIFMTANFASLFSRKKQLVLLHNSHYFEKRNPFSRFSLKIRYFLEKKLFYFTLIKKPHYIVQTNVMKEGLHKFCNVASYKAHALYMMPPRVFTNSIKHEIPEIFKDNQDYKKLFIPAKFHPNKNFHLIKQVGFLIAQSKLNIKIFVTLNNNDYTKWLDNDITLLNNVIINLGELEYNKIRSYYENIDMVLFPTSAESYGFPYIEAMICNKAIATTDSGFAHELLGENGYYFDLNANSVFEKINEFILHPKQLNYNVLNYIPEWEDYIKKIIEIYEKSNDFI